MIEQLAKLGIQVVDENVNYRFIKDVLNDLSKEWIKLSKIQRKQFIKETLKYFYL